MLTAARIVNILVFGDWAEIQPDLAVVPALLLRGLRFDLKLVAVVLLMLVWIPSLAPSRLLAHSLSRPMVRCALLLCLLLIIFVVFTDAGFLAYYRVPTDALVFGLFEDDTDAILKTIASTPVLLAVFGSFLIGATAIGRLFVVTTRALPPPRESPGIAVRLLTRLVVGVALVVLARGSLDTFPLQRKSASVGNNAFLNSMVMNGGFNLYYAWMDRQENTAGIFARDLLKQHGIDDYQDLLNRAGYSVAAPLIREPDEAGLADGDYPHVVFVLMEGWSSQIALRHSDDNPVLGALARHVRDDHFFTHVFTSTFATNSTIEALLLNSPVTPLSQSVAKNTSFDLSNLLPFKRNGYASAFISGGYVSWRNHQRFWPRQGFDRYIGRSEIENQYQVGETDHPWGVYDEYLFRKVREYLVDSEREKVPGFSFVLTTSNHSPMRMPPSYTPPALKPELYGLDPEMQSSHELITGFHYSSDQLGKFMDWLKNSELAHKVIVVATGDHPLRTLAKTNGISGLFLRYAVPAYVYLPPDFDRLSQVPGDITVSHNDLFPTLFELALPGTGYYRFGEALMDKKPSDSYGFTSRHQFLFRDGVVNSIGRRFYPWADNSRIGLSESASALTPRHAEIIERERYRKILKTHLLVEDYRKQLQRSGGDD